MAKILDFSTGSTISLESQMQLLALESGLVNNLIDRVKDIIPALMSKIAAVNDSIFGYSDKEKGIKLELAMSKHLSEQLKTSKFTNYNSVLISTPEGFHGSFLLAIKLFNDIHDDIVKDSKEALQEYNTLLASFITNKEDKKSLQDHTAFYKALSKKRTIALTSIGQHFTAKNSRTTARLGEVINRFADIPELVEHINKLARSHRKFDLEGLSKEIKNCTKSLQNIIDGISTGSISGISGQASNNLATGAYEIGLYIELVSVYRYRTEQLISSVDGLLSVMDEILAKE